MAAARPPKPRRRAAPTRLASAQSRARERRQRLRVDADEGAPAREREAGAHEPRCVSDGGEARQGQSFQPEWIATTPPVSRTNVDAREARAGDHLGETVGRREPPDRLDQVLIGGAIARHQRRRAPGMTLNE